MPGPWQDCYRNKVGSIAIFERYEFFGIEVAAN